MKQINIDKSVFEKLDHKHRNKSELVFNKLLVKQKMQANPFDETRTQSPPKTKEIKPGADYV